MTLESKVRDAFEGLARRVVPPPDAWSRLRARARRRYRRRLALRAVVVGVVVAVGIVAVPKLWPDKGIRIVPPADPTAVWKTYQNPFPRFAFRYPPTWHLQTFSERNTNLRGTLLTNTDRDLQRAPNAGRSAVWDFRELPANIVVVEVHHDIGRATTARPGEPDTPLPLSLDQAQVRPPDAAVAEFGVPPALVIPIRISGDDRYAVVVWFGQGASESDKESARQVVASLTFGSDGNEPLFDGTMSGWRIAPTAVIRSEGLERQLQLDCTPQEVNGETKTDLDFAVGYLPPGARLTTSVKTVCDGRGLSVSQWFAVDKTPTQKSAGSLRVERWLMDKRAFAIDADRSRVEACTISDHPAVCVRPGDDPLEDSIILLIEDDVLDPFATVLFVAAEGVPYSEALKVVNSVE